MALFLTLAVATAAAAQADFLDLCRTGTPDQVAKAIGEGADPNAHDENGMSPLMFAAALSPDPATVAVLIKAGAHVEAEDKLGDTPLMWAAVATRYAAVITTLLDAGSAVEKRASNGATALMLAACTSFSDLEMFKTVSNSVDLQLESQPAGAEAKTSLGPSCRTPCKLPITAGPDFTVGFTLDGYQPQTVAVKVIRTYARPDWEGKTRADPEFDPNPTHAVLVAVPPPPEPPKPPPAKKKPRVAAKPATAAPSSKGQTSSAGFAPAASTPFPPPPR